MGRLDLRIFDWMVEGSTYVSRGMEKYTVPISHFQVLTCEGLFSHYMDATARVGISFEEDSDFVSELHAMYQSLR